MKKTSKELLLEKLRNDIFNKKYEFIKVKLLNGGNILEINFSGNTIFEKIYNINSNGILCSDLKTFLPWDIVRK